MWVKIIHKQVFELDGWEMHLDATIHASYQGSSFHFYSIHHTVWIAYKMKHLHSEDSYFYLIDHIGPPKHVLG